jgi:Mycothiol maleylpyruvate isomerase N-terminal domain
MSFWCSYPLEREPGRSACDRGCGLVCALVSVQAPDQPFRSASVSAGRLFAARCFQSDSVDDRSAATPADLLAELREVGPRATATRRRLPAIVRAIRWPLPLLGVVPLGYLTDLIYTRDMWMHLPDLCHAAGTDMVQTAQHDGRIVALVMRDLGRQLMPKLEEDSIVYELAGVAGGIWRMGRRTQPVATLAMDVLDFNLLASGQLTPHDVRSRGLVLVSGDTRRANQTLANTAVPY